MKIRNALTKYLDQKASGLIKTINYMKGKDKFSTEEANELRMLIRQRCNADRSQQKSIRAKMRRIGFYGGDDFGIKDMTIEKFETLIRMGQIVIED